MMTPFTKFWSTDLTNELDTLRKKVGHLIAQKYDVHKEVENSEIQPGKKRKREVEWWLERVEEKEAVLKRIEAQLQEESPSRAVKNQVTKETKEVEDLIQQGKSFSTVVLYDHPSTRMEMVVPNLVGRDCDENVEMILEWLKDGGISAIGVYGMGGVGKTTLLKQIHNILLQDRDISGQVYWVTASQDCSLQKLQIAIGERLGLQDLEKEDDEQRRSLILQRLSSLQKTVVIIDDMWNHFQTDQLGILLTKCGCKIVITTRSSEVCRKMGCQKVIKVAPLLEEDAWSLFVEKSGEVPNAVIPTARGIVGECGGLPLALITMGCCMREVTDVSEWKNALHELTKPTTREDDMKERVFKILKYSFDGLANEKVQHCFLSCVLFPEDEEIRGDSLIDLWIMEGLLDDTEGWENKVNKGRTILNKLESLSLLESTMISHEERCVIMHDLIRDMAMIITQHYPRYMAKAGLQLKKVPEEKDWTCDLVKVSLSGNCIKEIPSSMSPKTVKLKVLIISDNFDLKQIHNSFFLHMEALEVLDLSGTQISRLPDSVSDLVNLRGLILDGCEQLEYVPSLAKLTKLMVLDLRDSTHIVGAPEGMEKLKCLEKLPYCKWGASDLPILKSLLQLCKLYIYRIVCGVVPEDAFRLHFYDRAVILAGADFEHAEIASVFNSTIQMIEIHNCCLGEVLPFQRVTANLQKLVIDGCTGLEYISFPLHSIAFLKLRRLPHLRSCSSFFQLQKLTIFDCPRIKVVFPTMPLHKVCLPYLLKLRVYGCEEVEEIFESCGESSSSVAANCTIPFPNLRELCLENMPELGSMYSMRLHLCTSVETINIISCLKLEGIFLADTISNEMDDGSNVTDPNGIVVLPKLKYLSLSDLPKLLRIIPTGDTKPTVNLPSMKGLMLKDLPNLSSIYSIGLHLSTSLESIWIERCPKLEGILAYPTDDTTPILGFPSLRTLELRDLPNLSSIYSMGLHLSTSLGSIQIEHCPKLEGIFASPTYDTRVLGFPSLRSLILRGLPNLSKTYMRRLHLSTSLSRLVVIGCPTLEADIEETTWGRDLSLCSG